MEKEEQVSVNTNAIREDTKNSSDSFENFQKQSTDNELRAFHLASQKERHRQSTWEFWVFLLVIKGIVLFIALGFIIFSVYKLNDLFSLIGGENGAIFSQNWHLPVVIIISLVSAVVAMFAILLRGLSRNIKSSPIEDVPLPTLAKAFVELGRIISLKNY